LRQTPRRSARIKIKQRDKDNASIALAQRLSMEENQKSLELAAKSGNLRPVSGGFAANKKRGRKVRVLLLCSLF